MSGYLEQIVAKVQSLEEGFKGLEAIVRAMQAGQGAQGAAAVQTQTPVATGNPFGAQPAATPATGNPFGATPAQPTVTVEMITALITPYVEIEAVKNVLSATMKGMGINALGETRPEQYAELYGKFQTVIGQYKEATGGAAAPAALI